MSNSAGIVDLDEKIAFLRLPRAYPHAPDTVTAIETHMSWIFLTGSLVYKLKKPVRYPFLDFSTEGRRKHYCEAELRLNRRLAGDVYRRVVPLRRDSSGRLSFAGHGEIVDWLVEMLQLPEQGMLNHALEAGLADASAVAAVAERLGRFYAAERPRRHAGYDYIRHLYVESDVNRKLLGDPRSQLPTERTGPLIARVEGLLRQSAPAILERIRSGAVVEGHGDLRPEHVSLGPPPRIIDCLEFDRSMRLLDPYDEVNYLGLECEMLGAAWVGPLVIGVVDRHLGRHPGPRLLAVYGAFRMLLRARICIAHLRDPNPRNPEIWPKRAERYLELVERECATAEGSADD